MGGVLRARYTGAMRITPSIMLAAIVACGSPAKSAEPTTPARSVSTTSAAEPAPGPAGNPERDRVAEAMVTFEKMLTALEPADGDCEALSDRVRAFARTEDADAIRAMSRDEELKAIIDASKERLERDYAPLKDRFLAVVRSCERDQDFQRAIDESGLFLKKRVDGPSDDAE